MKKNIKNRKSTLIPLPKHVLILCEGKSEEIYVKSYSSQEQNRRRLANVDIQVYQPKNYSPLGLLKEAKKRKEEAKRDKMPYDSIWIIFDKDGHANIPQTFEEAKDVKIYIIFSAICFEMWILLHFEKTSKFFHNCDEIVSYITKKKYLDYTKTNYFNQLTDEQKDIACENSKWLRKQNETAINKGNHIYELKAYTDFDNLMEYLQNIQ